MKLLWKITFSLFVLSAIGAVIFAPIGRTPASQPRRAPAQAEAASPTFTASEPVTPQLTLAVRDAPPYSPDYTLDREINPRINTNSDTDPSLRFPGGPDPLLALQAAAPAASDLTFIEPILNFNGQGYTGVNPPDTVGDVGLNHYIQMINGSGGAVLVIYNKAGSIVAGPIELASLGSGGNCASGWGDPIVLYDDQADRWMLSEFAGSGNHLCVYVSTSPDPTGTYFRYDFTTPNFPDYPKYAVWSDAYYVSSNENQPTAYALDRAQMLLGQPATSQRFTAPSLSGFGFQALTPSDLDGSTPPPAGAPNYFMRHRDTEVHGPSGYPTNDILEIWAFHVDFATPANSSFTKIADILVSEFDSDLCGLFSFYCFPQPGSSTTLDPLREVVMWRLQYRNFATHETLVGNLVTDVDGFDHGGVRWFELRKSGAGAWELFQEGTVAPDIHHRWMGSIAMDGSGDIALGYNVSSTTLYPSLRYIGRLRSDPLGTMPQGEALLVAGSGSNGSNRYGDYSAMSIDPADNCTFWFTGEYNAASTWSTRIGTFKFDQCTGGLMPDFTLQASPEVVSVCALSPAQYDVTVGSLVNFTQPVTLTLQGAPLGSAIAFSPNPVSPPGASLLSVTSPISAAWGTYNLDILGASIPPTYTVHTATVGLALFTNLPGLPELLFPAPEASSVSRLPTFLWAAEQGASFDLEVATDPGFSNLVIAASALTQTTFTPATPLAYNTVYFWRIKAHNTCGDSPYSPVSRFLTEAALGSCTQGRIPVSVLSEDFESGAPDWSPGGAASTWAANSVRKHGGAFSFKANDVSAVSDQWLTSPLIALPAAQSPLTLQYWNYQQLQSNPGGGCFDGGLVEISTDGGLSWSQLTSELQTDPYDGLIASGTGNPLAGRNAWCGHPQPWTETIITLDAFAGQQVLFRYRLGTNNAIASDGWYLDDLSVQACAPSSTLGPDSALTGAPAAVITHTFTLQNLGETDSYLLSLSGSTWDAHIVGANPVTVTQDGSVQIAVAVQLPPEMSVLSDTFTLSAASVNIPGIVLETTGTSALSLPVGLTWSASQSASGAPGETVLYTFTLTNTGSLTDTFTLATGGAWLAALPGGLNTGPLAAGESTTIVLQVTIPADALAGELDTTLLTAASTRDLAISASTSATTTAAVMRKVYLPLVMK